MSGVAHAHILGRWSTWTQTVDHCTCSEDTKACMGWT